MHLHIARDGEQAPTILHDAHFKSTVIILDLNFPVSLASRCWNRWKGINTPVVVFSSSASERAVLELGAREFIAKPTDIQEFTDIVCGIVKRYAGAADGACA